jgi:hypothetical protein
MEYFNWVNVLSKTSPLAYGGMTILTMVVLGAGLGILADLVFKVLRIDLGRYKKEYEEEEAVIKQG